MAKKKKGKDPAFMMYSGDFLSGTFTMTMEQRGKFITLMCIQHQKGFLTEADMKSVLNEEDYLLAEKFYKADDGNWYNQKMTDVINERKEYTANRLKNFQKKDDKELHKKYHKVSHMELHTGDEDEDESQDINLDEYTSADISIAIKQLDKLTEFIDDNNIPGAKTLLNSIKEDYKSFDNILQLCYRGDETILNNWRNYFANTLQFIN
jgi:hypothetical protein